jgi:hypothetical protein
VLKRYEFDMKLKSTLFAGLLAASLVAPAFANDETLAAPMPQFTAADTKMLFEQDAAPMQLAALSSQEMSETEGAIAPLVAIGIMTGARFIAQRYVTQRVAQQMVQRGATNVMAPNRAISNNIAGRGAIREFHAGPGARFTHFHTANRNGSHVWYGRPR